MKIKNILALLSILGLSSLTSCDKAGSAKTLERTELNPPGFLYTQTLDSKIQLRFTTANVEDDFKGYYVFGAKKSLSELTALVKYPKGTDILDTGIPYCADNSAFFEAFGLKATDKFCDTEDKTVSAEAENSFRQGFIQEETTPEETATKTTEEGVTNFLSCEENADQTQENATKMSLPLTGPSTQVQKCTVSKVFDGTALTDIVNGSNMTFVIFAVKGDNLDAISWSSNAVEDASSKTVIKSRGIEISEKQFQKITVSFSGDDVTASISETGTACDTKTLCQVFEKNAEPNNEHTIWIARDDTSNNYKQRVFVSAADGSLTFPYVSIRPRGAQTFDPLGDTAISRRAPSDEPLVDTAEKSYYIGDGTTFAAYGNQVFDLKFDRQASGINYGKLIVESISYSGTATAPGTATVTVSLIVQPGNGIGHYFW